MMQFATIAAIVSSTLLLKSHQPYNTGKDESLNDVFKFKIMTQNI